MKRLIFIIILIVFSQNHAQTKEHLCASSKIRHFTKLQKAAEINYPGDSRIDVKYYKLNLNIHYNTSSINGIVTVKAKSLIDNLSTIFLDLQDYFAVDSVKFGSTTLNSTLTYNNKLNIELDKIYNTDEVFSIDVFYKGSPGSSGFGSFEFSSHNGSPAIWTLSEPYGASDWWPCKDTPADKADSSDVWITADDFFVSVSNGILVDEIYNGDGTKTYKWKNSYPIAHYLISLAMTNYEVYQNNFEYEPGKFLPVIHYNYPEKLNSDRKTQLNSTVPMLEVFSNLFGPYPFLNEKYGHAEFSWGGGMEHQTISSMGAFFESIVAHELAHQWFGDKITCADWQNIWLNEGFATYAEALFVEATNGRSAYKNYIQNEMNAAKNAVGSIYVQNIKKISEIFNGNRSYAKGSVVLHMLRGIVSDKKFFNILKAYSNDPEVAYDVAETSDFQRVCETVSDTDLDYFFSEWIFGENYPKYSYSWGYKNITNNIYSVDLNISQIKNSNPKYFTMPIDVKIISSNGDTTITIFNDLNNQDFSFQIDGQPIDLEFDPDNKILKEIISSTTHVDNSNISINFSLSQNYPNPFNPETKINYTVPQELNNGLSSQKVVLKVYDVMGSEIATLVNEAKQSGNYEVIFNATNLPSGIYYYKIISGNFAETKKMVVLK